MLTCSLIVKFFLMLIIYKKKLVDLGLTYYIPIVVYDQFKISITPYHTHARTPRLLARTRYIIVTSMVILNVEFVATDLNF